jgi:hypothetical protein
MYRKIRIIAFLLGFFLVSCATAAYEKTPTPVPTVDLSALDNLCRSRLVGTGLKLSKDDLVIRLRYEEVTPGREYELYYKWGDEQEESIILNTDNVDRKIDLGHGIFGYLEPKDFGGYIVTVHHLDKDPWQHVVE